MNLSRRDEITPYVTRDGSEIRELLHPEHHAVRHQSLAEASVAPGQRTLMHRHRQTEEIYFILAGSGLMTLDENIFPVQAGDSILIRPGAAHCIENRGAEALRILCCCAPAYSHADTEVLEERC